MKRLLLIVLLLLTAGFANANNVDQNTAKEIGKRFLKASVNMDIADNEDLQLITTYNTSDGKAALYIFNSRNGFVIVSADDCAIPILGYSNESVFTVGNVPIQMEEYLQHFVEQIQYGIENHLVADEATAHQWELVRTTGLISEERGNSAVAPLLTDTWNQNCYYNNLCPADPAGPCGHVYVGCAATAFSQIMHYWGYPTTGTGSHSYTPAGYPQQSVNFGATTYQWNNMPNNLSSSSTATQINAVATLMWHCGVAIDMAYGPNGSSGYPGSVATAFVEYFNYSNDLYTASKNYYTNTQWLNMVKNDLNNNRPIHYSGWNSEGGGGHGFVCDGYDSNDMLHFNWGWSGYYNNYYALDALTLPDGSDFSYNNYAIFNIRPNLPSYQVTISSNPSNGGSVSFGGKGDRTSTTYDFDDGTMMNWTSLDADGDGNGWVSSSAPGIYHNSGINLSGTGHNGSEAYVISGSYANQTGQALTPNNFLISPTKAAYSHISFYACSQDANYAAEHFGIAVSTTGNTNASSFTTIQEWTLTAKNSSPRFISSKGDSKDQGMWYNYNVDLSAYAGQDIWVAIRHFNCTDQFILNIDDITLTTGGGGGGNSISAYFQYGQTCTMTATANSGYYFTNWTENGTVVSNSTSYSYTVTGDRTLVANFTTTPPAQQYTITISANPSESGSVAFGSKELTNRGWYYYDNGTNVDAIGTGGGNFWWGIMLPAGSYTGNALTKVAAYDYEAMTGTASIYQGGDNAPSGAAIGTMDIAFTGSNNFVEFTFAEPVTINPQQNVWVVFYNGSGAAYPAAVCNNTGDANGRWVSLDGSNWVDLTSYSLDYTFMVRAYIEQGASSAVYTEGQSCTVVATANSGYNFTNWKENGTVVSTNASYSFTVTGNRTLVANFSAAPPQQYTISVSANPSNGGTVSGGGTFTQGATCTLTATANTGYTFVNWTKNGTVVSTNPSYSFTVNASGAYVANFTLNSYNITASANPAAGGTVTGAGTYNHGASCTLTATPNANYNFVNWTKNGTIVSSNPTYTFSVTSDGNYIANFSESVYYTIIVEANPEEGGTVTGSGTFLQGQSCTVMATANSGYTFTNWKENGTVVSTNASYTFTVNGNRTLVAYFSATQPPQQQYTVTISADPYYGGTVAFGSKGDRATTTYDFDDDTMMNWTSLDADGDGNGWVSSSNPGIYHYANFNASGTGHNGSEAYVLSGSYANQTAQALTPDNFLISPTKAAYSQISFYACAQDANFAAEHFGVAVSTTDNTSASSFTTIQEWTLTAKDSKEQGTWYNYNVDLSAYAGQDIWVAIRHFNCTDQFIINIDDITLTTGGDPISATFMEGQSCTVVATANRGYNFTNWTENGVVVSTNANYTFTVNDDRSLVAHFEFFDGVDDISAGTFVIYPNPVKDKLMVVSQETVDRCCIYNVSGALVISQDADSDTFEVEVGALRTGAYIISLTTGDKVKTLRFIKD